MNTKEQEEAPLAEATTKSCGRCHMTIPIKATKYGIVRLGQMLQPNGSSPNHWSTTVNLHE